MIKVKDSIEFKRLIRALSDDIILASIHWQMRRDLLNAMTAYPLVEQQTPTFWYVTLKANLSAAVLHLCRAFDQEERSLHLLSWLLTIKANLHLFSPEEFRKRLSNSPFVDSLATNGTVPDDVQLAKDIALCRAATDPLVKKLVSLRGNTLAHRSARLARGGSSPPASMVLSDSEVDTLIARATTILNRYNLLFAAEAYSTKIVGASDHEFIFKMMQATVEASRARTAELLRTQQQIE